MTRVGSTELHTQKGGVTARLLCLNGSFLRQNTPVTPLPQHNPRMYVRENRERIFKFDVRSHWQSAPMASVKTTRGHATQSLMLNQVAAMVAACLPRAAVTETPSQCVLPLTREPSTESTPKSSVSRSVHTRPCASLRQTGCLSRAMCSRRSRKQSLSELQLRNNVSSSSSRGSRRNSVQLRLLALVQPSHGRSGLWRDRPRNEEDPRELALGGSSKKVRFDIYLAVDPIL